jgi:flagellar FliJ protein
LKRFKFDLEKVLELRSYREREMKIDLGRAMGALTEIEHKSTALAKERLRAADERFSPRRSAAEMHSYDLYILRLDKTRDRLLEAAAQAELKLAEARERYLEASRDRKVLDKVKERRYAEYRKAALAGEVKVLDDISGGAPARANVGGGS